MYVSIIYSILYIYIYIFCIIYIIYMSVCVCAYVGACVCVLLLYTNIDTTNKESLSYIFVIFAKIFVFH